VTPSLTPQMVLDIHPGITSSNLSGMVAIGSTTYFSADDGVHGRELWKSDGTAAGTILVKDIVSYGLIGSNPGRLTNVNGTQFFTAEDANGYELWKSDGTAAGTTLVKDIYPGTHLEYDYYGARFDPIGRTPGARDVHQTCTRSDFAIPQPEVL
jgi:ELWxxDGT repeat protein